MSRDWILLALRISSPVLLYAFLALIWFQMRSSRQSAPAPAVLRLLGQPEQAVSLANPTTIGRADDNTITISNDFVSAYHAVLAYRSDRWWLTDLNSTNGTLLNRAPLNAPTPLRSGDVISLGETHYRLELED